MTPGKSERRCGVAAMITVPAVSAARAISTEASSDGGPSSIPGSRWAWVSTKHVMLGVILVVLSTVILVVLSTGVSQVQCLTEAPL